MSESNGNSTQRDLRFGIEAELAAAGFDDAEEIGHGGFGVVYRCAEQVLDRTVAVKVLTAEVHGDERERFVREQKALGRLSGHPYIVPVFQVDITSTGKPFIVMPFYSHGSLDTQLRSAGPFQWRDALSIAVKLAEALAFAHAHDIVHRDVKPGNVLLTDYGQPLLADFGIARFRGDTGEASEVLAGTPAFIAPEVLGGEIPQASSDVYSLGATLFCLVTGHAAFERRPGESLPAQLRRITSASTLDPRAQGVPEEMSAAIGRATAIDPANRCPSAAQFGELCREVQRRYRHGVDTVEPLRRGKPGTASDGRGVDSVEEQVPPTASTRFRPPTPARPLVHRPRLLRILRHGQPRRLALIHAPAGFGKSTLAAQWGHTLEAAGTSVAWLTVDTDDDNVVWFLMHLVETVRRVRPELARDLRGILEERASGGVRHVITTLIDEIHASGEPVVVVIDNWERVTSQETIKAMGYLIEHGCHHLRLVVTSRTQVGLPLSKMGVDDELVEIDSTDLRFDAAEAQSFLVDVNGLPLAPPDVSTLQESTHGWAAALQLASLSLRGHGDPAEFIGRLSSHQRGIGEYLADNVLEQVDAAVLDFLLSTCVTERICGELATALSGVASGHDMLEQVCKRDLFLHRAKDDDTDLEWFRYHPLFADYLQHRLARLDRERALRLHRIASTWFADHGLPNDAVDHALAAQEPERAVQYVLDQANELLGGSRMATFLGLAAKLPQAMAAANPLLQLSVAWANLSTHRGIQARAAFDNVDAALDADTTDPRSNSDLRAEVAAARACEQFMTDRFEAIPDIAIAHLIDDATLYATPFGAAAATAVACLGALNRFDFDGVRRLAQRTAPHQPGGDSPSPVMYSHCLAGLAAYEQLDIPAAETSLRAAYLTGRGLGTHSHASRVAGPLLGGLLYQKGKLDDAEALLDEGLELGSQGQVESILATYSIGARIKAVRGDLAAAERRLTEGAEIAENLSLPRVAACMVDERVRCGLTITEDERIRLLWLAPYRRRRDAVRAITSELEQDSAIRLLLAENTPSAVEGACARVECMIREIGTQNRPRALLQAQLLRIACLAAASRLEEALSSVGALLTQCAEHDLPRFVVDTGPRLGPVIAAFQDNIGAPGRLPPIFMRNVMAAFDQADHFGLRL